MKNHFFSGGDMVYSPRIFYSECFAIGDHKPYKIIFQDLAPSVLLWGEEYSIESFKQSMQNIKDMEENWAERLLEIEKTQPHGAKATILS